MDPVRLCVVSLGLDGTVEVLLAVEDVGPVADAGGLLAAECTVDEVAVLDGFVRSRAKVVGGLLGVVVGRFGGMLPLTGGFVKLEERVLSGDFGPSDVLGLVAGLVPILDSS